VELWPFFAANNKLPINVFRVLMLHTVTGQILLLLLTY